MNYVKVLMTVHSLSIGKRFAINGCEKYTRDEDIFYFDGDYNLRSGSGKVDHNSIFLKLLTGVYSIVID